MHPTRAQLEGSWEVSWSTRPFIEEPTGAQRGGKAKSHETLELSPDKNHAGLQTPHPEAASEEGATALGGGILTEGWGGSLRAAWLSPAQGARPWVRGKSQAKSYSSQPSPSTPTVLW